MFIIDVNYWLSLRIHENGEKPLSINVFLEYPEIKELFNNRNKKEIFNEALSLIKIDYLKENENMIFFYLIKSMQYEDIDDINREIEYETYNQEYLRKLL